MPTKERRERESRRIAEKDGDYGIIDTAYVFGNPTFRAMPAAWKCAEMLAWLACFKERTDHLKPEWVSEIKRMANTQRSLNWRRMSEYLAKNGRWKVNSDGSITVLRIKEKRPHFNWKEKGHKGQKEGTKTGNKEGITPSSGGEGCPSRPEVEPEKTVDLKAEWTPEKAAIFERARQRLRKSS